MMSFRFMALVAMLICAAGAINTLAQAIGQESKADVIDLTGAVEQMGTDNTAATYVQFALDNSPRVAAQYYAWQAAKHKAPQAQAWPDPRVTVGVFAEPIETRTGPQRARVGLQQTVPLSSKLTDLHDAAQRQAAAAYRLYQATELTVASDVVQTLYDLSYTDAAKAITQDNLTLLQSFEAVVRARYQVGQGDHPQLIRVQLEVSKLKDRQRQLGDLRQAQAGRLNSLLNRPVDQAVPSGIVLPQALATQTAKLLIDRARMINPQLLAMDERTAAQRHMQAAARAQRTPDLTVGVDYIVTDSARNPNTPGSGDDPVMFSVGINLPLWGDKYAAAEAEALSERIRTAYARAAEANALSAAIQKSHFEHVDANDRAVLYRKTLIPQAQQSLNATLSSFRAGNASFLDLIDAQRTLLTFSLAAEQAAAQRGKALAKLNALVGESVQTITLD